MRKETMLKSWSHIIARLLRLGHHVIRYGQVFRSDACSVRHAALIIYSVEDITHRTRPSLHTHVHVRSDMRHHKIAEKYLLPKSRTTRCSSWHRTRAPGICASVASCSARRYCFMPLLTIWTPRYGLLTRACTTNGEDALGGTLLRVRQCGELVEQHPPGGYAALLFIIEFIKPRKKIRKSFLESVPLIICIGLVMPRERQ